MKNNSNYNNEIIKMEMSTIQIKITTTTAIIIMKNNNTKFIVIIVIIK